MEEGDLVQAPRGFVEDDGREAKKECHFRSHDTTGPADHLLCSLLIFGSSSGPLHAPFLFVSLFSINARRRKSVTNERNRWTAAFRLSLTNLSTSKEAFDFVD